MAKYKFSKTIKPGEGIVILASGQVEPILRRAETPRTEETLQLPHDKAPEHWPVNNRDSPCQGIRNQAPEKAKPDYAAESLKRKSDEILRRLKDTNAMLQLQKDLNPRRLSTHGDSRFIVNLATPSSYLQNTEVHRFVFLGIVHEVRYWVQVLRIVLGVLAEKDPDRLSSLYTMGLMKWIKRSKRSFCEKALDKANFVFDSSTGADNARMAVQWLLEMFDIGLEKAGVEVSPRIKRPKGWSKRFKVWPKDPSTPEEIPRCRFCGAAVRDLQQHMRTAHASLLRLSLRLRKQQTGQGDTVDARLMQGPIETATSGSDINYGSRTRSGLLVGSDGIVIGRTAPAAGERDKSVVRSQSNVEDYWKGFGFMARDGGRYGSINGEDYAD